MTRQLDAVLRRRGLQRPAGPGCGDRGCEVVLEHTAKIADAEGAEDKNLRRHSRLAEDDRLLDIGAREDRGAGILQCERDSRRSMAVCVGLDDANDARRART